MPLAQQFAVYGRWRDRLVETVSAFKHWLDEQRLETGETRERLAPLLERLESDHLNIAFVAEFSRGKSELINSIFFPDYGCRILPSCAGRTTMCPTEIFHLPNTPPELSLLPIETRLDPRSMREFRETPGAWSRAPLRIDSAEEMQTALRRVSETLRVSPEEAQNMGFSVNDEDHGLSKDKDGKVEIPRWRHALINFPHPFLKEGLVILDTPGLNAIGAEPELTLSLLPKAHVILFLLAADTGVTQSDLAVWKTHIGPNQHRQGRLVALNKIDSLWDSLRSETELQTEIDRQTRSCADILNLDTSQIFPVSAQKGLTAKIHGDETLLARSRLPELEHALSRKLIPSKRHILQNDVAWNFRQIYTHTLSLLQSRQESVTEQIEELSRLNGKNRKMLEFTLNRARMEKDAFSGAQEHFHVTFSILRRLSGRLRGYLSLSALRELIDATREAMQKGAFSQQLSHAMSAFFGALRENLSQSEALIREIRDMTTLSNQRMIAEYALRLPDIPPFSLTRQHREVQRLESWCDTHINTLSSLMTREKHVITQKFFSEVVQQTTTLAEDINRGVENWLTAIQSPFETQIRERQSHLERRLKNVRRVLEAESSLMERIQKLEAKRRSLRHQIQRLNGFRNDLGHLLLPRPTAVHPLQSSHGGSNASITVS